MSWASATERAIFSHGFQVVGGRGKTTVWCVDLEQISTVFARAADDMQCDARAVAELTFVSSPMVAPVLADFSVAELLSEFSVDLAAWGIRLGVVAEALLMATKSYRVAEELVLLAVEAAARQQSFGMTVAVKTAAWLGGVTGVLAGTEVAVHPTTNSERMASQSAATSPKPPNSLAEMQQRILEQARSDEGGQVRVERVTGEHETSWIVYIPGTQVVAVGESGNVFDLNSDIQALAGQQSAAGALVEEALQQSGVAPGDDVLLAGYSLGGITAAALAANPRFSTRYQVSHVFTVGAPIGGFKISKDIGVLSIEHREDPIPALDGRPNPITYRQVTVTKTSGTVNLADPLASHSSARYLKTLSELDHKHDPQVDEWKTSAAKFFDQTRQVTAVEYVGVRSLE